MVGPLVEANYSAKILTRPHNLGINWSTMKQNEVGFAILWEDGLTRYGGDPRSDC